MRPYKLKNFPEENMAFKPWFPLQHDVETEIDAAYGLVIEYWLGMSPARAEAALQKVALT